MLKLKNGYWTLKGQKYTELNPTLQLIFNLLLSEKLNKNYVA